LLVVATGSLSRAFIVFSARALRATWRELFAIDELERDDIQQLCESE
jgi:hypothetical protein